MEKIGLGFQSDEAEYENELSKEIEGLVLEENKLDREKLVDHEKGFHENDFTEKNVGKDVKNDFIEKNDGKDVKEGFNSDVGLGKKDEENDFNSDVGSDKEGLIEGFYGDEGFDTDDVEEGFDKQGLKESFNGDVGFDRKGLEKTFYGDVGFDEQGVKEGSSGENSEWVSEQGGKEGYNGVKSEWFSEEGEKDGVNGVKSEWGYDGNNSYPVRGRFDGGVGFDREDGREGFYDDAGFGGGVREGYNGGEKSWGYNGNNNHPVRPDAEDCQYYMRFGACKYGPTCKFNHPLRRRNQAAKEKEDYSERPGKVECKYHTTPGGCKFGTGCKFNHSSGKTSAIPGIEFNFLGLPIRQGETECDYYMRNGSCKYGSSCRFNHPQPTNVGHEAPTSRYNVNGGNVSSYAKPQTNMSSWSSSRNAVNGGGSMSPYSPTTRVANHNVEWNSYQAPMYPATERRLPNPPAFALNNQYENNFYTNNKMPMTVEDFPERPGEPECSYFIKTGDCKYRSGCKFHHPKDRTPSSAACALSDKGLPLRPDQPVCSYYTRYGLCKYGPACRYDHPANNDNSASSPFSGQSSPLPVSARW